MSGRRFNQGEETRQRRAPRCQDQEWLWPLRSDVTYLAVSVHQLCRAPTSAKLPPLPGSRERPGAEGPRGGRDEGHGLSWTYHYPPHLGDGPCRGGSRSWGRSPRPGRPARLPPTATPLSFQISRTWSSLKPLPGSSFQAQMPAPFPLVVCPGESPRPAGHVAFKHPAAGRRAREHCPGSPPQGPPCLTAHGASESSRCDLTLGTSFSEVQWPHVQNGQDNCLLASAVLGVEGDNTWRRFVV